MVLLVGAGNAWGVESASGVLFYKLCLLVRALVTQVCSLCERKVSQLYIYDLCTFL